jgi:hypothetical protein
MRRSEFCQNRGLSFSTRDRNLKKRRWKGRRQPVSSAGRLVPLELSAMKSPAQHEPSCGLAVLLPSGLRIEVHPNFDTNFRTPGRCSGAEISRVWTGSSHTDLSCRRSHRHAQGVRGALRSCPRRLSYDPLSGHLFLFCNSQRNRSPPGGPQDCGDSFGRGNLPSAASPGARLLFPRFSQAMPISRCGAFQTLLPLCGMAFMNLSDGSEE